MSSHLTSIQTLPRSVSTAALKVKEAQQAEYVKELWLLLTAVIGLLTVINWSSRLLTHLCRRRTTPLFSIETYETSSEKGSVEAPSPGKTRRVSLRRLPVAFASFFRAVVFRTTVPIGPSSVMSVAELAFILGYIAALLTWLWINTQDLETFYFEDRAAHLASCQVPLIVALAGKNNIISFLTGVSHERLNVLHRASARACLLLLWIHALIRGVSGLPEQFDLANGWMRWGVAGLTAFSLATILSIRPIRMRFFEFFLISHIFLIFIFILGGLIHAGSRGFGAYFWPALLVWGLDRFLRLSRLVWNNRVWSRTSPEAHHASIELLTSDTVRLTLRRKMNWTPGQHAYVILPSVSKLPTEAHPFTIASIPHSLDGTEGNDEKEIVFLIRGQSGFTGRLREHASRKGAPSSVPAYIDGPYGTPPDLKKYSTCLLIAGGSGISYILPLLLDLVHHASKGTSSCQRIFFVWIVRQPEHMEWMSKILVKALRAAPPSLTIEPHIFFTTQKKSSTETLVLENGSSPSSPVSLESPDSDATITTLASISIRTSYGRPDVEWIVQQVVSLSSGPVSIDVAGPSSLSSAVRAATSFENTNPIDIMKGQPTVTLHVETFGMVKT